MKTASEALPLVILDSDSSGQSLAKQLLSGVYVGASDRIIMVGDICGITNGEIEDLFPQQFLAKVISRQLRGPDDDFSDVVKEGEPIVSQVQKYAESNGLKLEPGWKVEFAIQAKARLLRNDNALKNEEATVEQWKKLFQLLS